MVGDHDNLASIKLTMDRIDSRIQGHELLARLDNVSQEDICRLKKQYGGEAVDIGIEIVGVYRDLLRLVARLHRKSS